MYKSLLPFLFLLVTVTCSFGQDKQLEKKLDELLTRQFKQDNPGGVILVAKHGQVMYKKAFGSANLQLNVPMCTDMVFNIASVTKQFTAVAILQLVEQGKISLQDSLQKFVPDYPSRGHTITIEHLLTHTSGIRDYMQIDFSHQNMERWDFSPKQLIDTFKNYPLVFDPGTKFSYSNSGYYLLGYIIERVSGKPYQDYIQENLLKPLGLTHAYFDRSGIIIPKRVNGYLKDGSGFRNEDFWSPTIEYSTGGLITNVEDLLSWHNGLYSYQVLKKEHLEKAFKPFVLKDKTETSYGYGWFLKSSNGVRSIEHQGGIPGFQCNEIFYPEEDVFIAILCNSGAAPIDELSINISNIALGKSLQPGIKVATKILDQYIGKYQLTIDTNRVMEVIKENDQLIARVSANNSIPLIFQSETKFQFKNVLNANCEFVIENGQVTKFNVTQNGHYEWARIR